MHRLGVSFAEIARQLGLHSAPVAYRIWTRALRRQVPRAVVDEEITAAVDRLTDQRGQIRYLMSRTHYVVQQGKIVKDDEGQPLIDHGFQLQCHDRLLRVEERLAKMLGLDAPQRARIEVLTRDKWQEAMDEARAELDELDRQIAIEAASEPVETPAR